MTAMFAYQSKRKREELNNHINRLEQLISQDRAALTTKEVISKQRQKLSGMSLVKMNVKITKKIVMPYGNLNMLLAHKC